uniref:MHD1 domain-containing protein n=1 Tax=Romanomermis culicivorax TaxID=13658 RepID=A0A915KBU1_ROMCU
MADAVNKQMLNFDLNDKSDQTFDENLVPVLELYSALAEFQSYKQHFNPEERQKLSSTDYSNWFEGAVVKWLSMVKDKAFQRVEMACQVDRR